MVSTIKVPEFSPRAGLQIQVKDDEPVNNQASGGKSICLTVLTLVILIFVNIM
jgi:hypothetical protein